MSSDARIVVLQPPGQERQLARGLESLAGDVTVEIYQDAEACLRRMQAQRVDVLVLDATLTGASRVVLDHLPRSGPPVVVVDREASEHAVLAWYRAGAANCIDNLDRLGPAVAEWCGGARKSDPGAGLSRLDAMTSALVVVDPDGRVVFGSPAAEQLLGASGGAFIGASVWSWLGSTTPEEPCLARSLRSGECFQGVDSRITHSDGRVVPVTMSSAPIDDASGERTGAVVILQDLTGTERRRGDALQTEKLASIGQLAAGVAHEINNPMGFIHANLFQLAEYAGDLRKVWRDVEALQRAIGGGDASGIQQASEQLARTSDECDIGFVLSDLTKAIRESQEGSERVRHIVQDLRDFSHQDTGELVLADINQCLESTANIARGMMKHVASVEKRLGDLPPVLSYPMQLQQVFMNLLVNACQAIEEAADAPEAHGTIHLATEAREDGVVVTVRDTGVGIPAEHLDRIFDPFFTTKKVGAGTGLGLSTSFGIVQKHGGTLTVESQPGQGSKFRLFLPLEPPEDPEAESA